MEVTSNYGMIKPPPCENDFIPIEIDGEIRGYCSYRCLQEFKDLLKKIRKSVLKIDIH